MSFRKRGRSKTKNMYTNKKRKTKINYLRLSIACVIIFALIFGGYKLLFSNNNIEASENAKNNPPKVVEQPKPQPKPDDIIPNSNVTYEGKKYAVDVHDVKKMLDGKYEGNEKYVFLTFDDGPSPLTNKNLDTLKGKGVKATFFILGNRLDESEKSKETLKRTIKEGNAIANHSYTHNLKKLYPHNKTDVNYFMEEFNKTNNSMKAVLGEEFDTRVLRMPGGYNSRQYYKDKNLPELNEAFAKKDIVSIDWNALNGDAEGKPYSTESMLEYVKKSSAHQNKVVILMHDTYGKEKTAKILPEVIDYFKSQGYEFKTMSC